MRQLVYSTFRLEPINGPSLIQLSDAYFIWFRYWNLSYTGICRHQQRTQKYLISTVKVSSGLPLLEKSQRAHSEILASLMSFLLKIRD